MTSKEINLTNKSIEDTGERMIPAYHKGHMVFGEHIVRYEAAKDLVNNKVILDIASGSGYGTSILSTSAKKAYGVDVDPVAIKYAKNNYEDKNTSFKLGDGSVIPFDDDFFDVIISFVTIEHISKYEEFVQEVSRVLKPSGLFILSTPNDIEFPEGNHYHVHEFVEEELDKLVGKYFKNTRKYYQTTWLYNMLSEKKLLDSEWTEEIRTTQTAPTSTKHALYFFLLCSNRKITESIAPLSAISEHWSARILEENDKSIREHIEEQGKVIAHLENKLTNISKRYRHIESLYSRFSNTKSRLKS